MSVCHRSRMLRHGFPAASHLNPTAILAATFRRLARLFCPRRKGCKLKTRLRGEPGARERESVPLSPPETPALLAMDWPLGSNEGVSHAVRRVKDRVTWRKAVHALTSQPVNLAHQWIDWREGKSAHGPDRTNMYDVCYLSIAQPPGSRWSFGRSMWEPR